MHVLATAGHVDHGKSTLVRALTGMEPDRWAEERRRGMTIDLGYAWMQLPSGAELAFVDVPGHERFLSNMLAGIGPAPAVLMVVAADEGWRRQSGEHLEAIDALGIRHGLLVVTRADLADPAPALADARRRIAETSLGQVDAVAVSAVTGQGLPELLVALDRLVGGLPAADVERRVRLWVDRAFTVRGSGTVVTGTLGAGTIAVEDELDLGHRRVRVRGLQQLGRPTGLARGVARVAVNLRSVDAATVRRGEALLTAGSWHFSETVDVRLCPLPERPPGGLAERLSGRLTERISHSVVVHVGSASVAATVRSFGADTARLTLREPLPLEVGDRVILRDPGRHAIIAGAVVLDADPPALHRRGAGPQRARQLEEMEPGDAVAQVRSRGAVRRSLLRSLGYSALESPAALEAGVRTVGNWLIDEQSWQGWSAGLLHQLDRYAAANPQQPEMPADALRKELKLPPDRILLDALVSAAALRTEAGRVSRPGVAASLGTAEGALQRLELRWRTNPFDAPTKADLAELGLTGKHISAAAKSGRLLRLDDVVLAPDALERAAAILATLAQPFTTSAAGSVLGTTRRVTIPLLECLDRKNITVRDGAERRLSYLGPDEQG